MRAIRRICYHTYAASSWGRPVPLWGFLRPADRDRRNGVETDPLLSGSCPTVLTEPEDGSMRSNRTSGLPMTGSPSLNFCNELDEVFLRLLRANS